MVRKALAAGLVVILLFTGVTLSAELSAKAPGPYFPLKAADHHGAATFTRGQPIVGTTYFYWYDIDTNAHIIDYDGTDALTDHPADMNDLSFRRKSWHRRQLLDMVDAGLDFLMPVYWGVPGDYKAWSFVGLPPLVEAHSELESEGVKVPAIGMFFDTSIMQWNDFDDGRPYHVDLTTEFGRRWFYTAIRDFFSMIPPAKWARVDGEPIVFLYGANFAKAQDERAISFAKSQFEKDFGVGVFIVKNVDWKGQADATYSWGGAVNGPLIFRQTASIGPGYDHSAVPGRKPLIVDRKWGATYIERWSKLLQLNPEHRPWLVHVETWNEWHEGTDVADTREYGRTYIVLTRLFADMWHGRNVIKLKSGYVGAENVRWQVGKPAGIDIRPGSGDGFWRQVGKEAVVSTANPTRARYLYFNVDDAFAFDLYDATVTVTVEYKDSGCKEFRLEYDNTDPTKGAQEGAFRGTKSVPVGDSGQWKLAKFTLEKCRFMNRCNGADMRLAVVGGDGELMVRSVTVDKNN